jgi:putative ABC transport system substrate-binding protein
VILEGVTGKAGDRLPMSIGQTSDGAKLMTTQGMATGSTILTIVTVVAVLLFATQVGTEAQPAGKVPRIGFLMSTSPSTIADRLEAFRWSLRELGYLEGKNIVVEYRWAEGKIARLPDLATELVRLKADVIVTAGPTVTRAAKEASSTIPIVVAFDSDPVGSGVAASLARPGGNITGLSTLAPEISGKQLELLKEIVPASRAWPSSGLRPNPARRKRYRAWKSPQGRLRCSFNT